MLLLNCQKIEEQPQIRGEVIPKSSSGDNIVVVRDYDEPLPMVIGQQLPNPYSMSNMRQAFTSLNLSQEAQELQPTHYYVQLKPSTRSELELLLADTSLILRTYPLDHEVIAEGQYYIDPNVSDSLLTYRYTVVPVGQSLPNVPHLVLDTLYKPRGVEYEVEVKAFEVCNHPDAEIMRTRSRFKPAGYVYVRDNNKSVAGNNVDEPLILANIEVGNSFWWYTATTNNLGYFSVNVNFTNDVKVYLTNRNGLATIRGSFFEYLGFNVSDYLGTVNSAPVNLLITPVSGIVWRKATVYKAVTTYTLFALQNGISAPLDLNIWLGNAGSGAGGAPLFRKIGHIGPSMPSWMYWFLNEVCRFSNNIIEPLVKDLYPDIVISTELEHSHQIKATTYHELAHYSHYIKAGNVYWKTYIEEIVNVHLHNPLNKPYGNGSRTNAGYIAVGEAWAGYIGNIVAANEYEGFAIHNDYIILNEFVNPYLIPAPSGSTVHNWIPHGLLFDVFDPINFNENIELRNIFHTVIFTTQDLVQGISPMMVYSYLGPHIISIPALKLFVLANNPTQQTQLNLLFQAYGY